MLVKGGGTLACSDELRVIQPAFLPITPYNCTNWAQLNTPPQKKKKTEEVQEERGFLFLFDSVLHAQCDTDGRERQGDTPVHYAASEGHVSILRYCIAASKGTLNPPKFTANLRVCYALSGTDAGYMLPRCEIKCIETHFRYRLYCESAFFLFIWDAPGSLCKQNWHGETPLIAAAGLPLP
eukprot:1981469-Rhodomonas_salina.1